MAVALWIFSFCTLPPGSESNSRIECEIAKPDKITARDRRGTRLSVVHSTTGAVARSVAAVFTFTRERD